MATLADTWKVTHSAESAQFFGRTTSDTTVAESASTATDVIAAGDFRINLAFRKVTIRDHELRLTCPEFDLLVFLISHRRRVVTPSTTLATKTEECGVRQAQFLPTLLSLRKKLQEAAPGRQYIQTEAWILYDFHPGS